MAEISTGNANHGTLCLILVLAVASTCAQASLVCNILDPSNSQCSPKSWQLDKACEATREEGFCSDCLDCDPCRVYSYDCDGCIANGCVWCAGDALCSSVVITQETWTFLQDASEVGAELKPSCLAEEDWTAISCSVVVNDGDENIATANSPTSSDSAAVNAAGTYSNATNTTLENSASSDPTIFSDPLMGSMMWLYDMIHVVPVWQSGILGQGVHIRVNDVFGVDATHAEFDSRFDEIHSCEVYLPIMATELLNPALENAQEHGTAVASLAFGGANNDQCAVGIAPKATFSACLLPAVANPFVYATIMTTHLEVIDISVNAWSLNSCYAKQQVRRSRQQRHLQQESCPFLTNFSSSPCAVCGNSLATAGDDFSQLSPDCRIAISEYCRDRFALDIEACSIYLPLYAECFYSSVLAPEELDALEMGIQQGRDGKGVIFVMSAGNERATGESTNGQKYVASRYTISVGAVDKNEQHASYSSIGASLFVSAPGGNLKHLSNNIVAQIGGGCHDIKAGTSFSAPVVAGVVALMLEVNPSLTWRDIQGILASTSQKVYLDSGSWATNAAGFQHSYTYGFGVVHAQDAVAAAETWTLWAPEVDLAAESELALNLQIPTAQETNRPVETSLTIKSPEEAQFEVESVVVWLNIDHPSRGDLTIVLTSPQNTASILHESPRPENTHPGEGTYWEFMTVRAWGESPHGNWTLSILDERPGNLRDTCVDMPWLFLLDSSPQVPTGAMVTCLSIGRTLACADGKMVNPNVTVLVDPSSQLTPDKACCVCGGGMPPTQNAQLKDWKLVVYGRGATTVGEKGATSKADQRSHVTGLRMCMMLLSVLFLSF
jgi:Subtilase family/Proprotein convertase P-domain